ncbi:hypothetical protein [Sulfurovum sp. NBC37-1]|uniref:hypothetical protein n=1 Tax=Sulfurovum sp. (strain NBC37-1) TaxID=387093 RepID=UPI0001587544|nr:hypothetical protein [Sulfurovum sp. NBC37-1]BAF71183.1 hypothetical protein SUN_0223 [Sulfurovum sp. NBC37-1]
MQLSELLEENTTKTISERTKISEENLEYLLNNDFGAIKKVKMLGFISILEREYGVNLSKLKEEAMAYYDQHGLAESVTMGLPIIEEKKGRSKWLWLIVPILLGYASWFFFKNYDQSQLKALLPFNEASSVEKVTPKNTEVDNEELSITNVLAAEDNKSAASQNDNNINSSENK